MNAKKKTIIIAVIAILVVAFIAVAFLPRRKAPITTRKLTTTV